MSAYDDLCQAMSAKGWLSHPLACVNRSYGPGHSLTAALRSTRTYDAFAAGRELPRNDERSATSATFTYVARRGGTREREIRVDRVLVDRSAGFLTHIHSITGHRTIAFLDDIPPEHITSDVRAENIVQPLARENALSVALIEGKQTLIALTVHERNPIARRRCIEYYGTSCAICGFSFAAIYGDACADRIHVHHLTPISDHEDEHEINPIEDLRPVCANCHLIIHSEKPPLSISAVKQLIMRARGSN